MPKFFGLFDVSKEEHTILVSVVAGLAVNMIFNYLVKPYLPPAPLEPVNQANMAMAAQIK